MSHFCVIVVTDSPEDVETALAPFDENLDVDPHPETIGAVAEQAKRARSFYLDYPQHTPESLMNEHFWDVERWDLTGPSLDRPNLKVDVTPGDKTANPWDDAYGDKHQWANRADAKRWLDGIPDSALALVYAGGDYEGARIDGENVIYDSTRNPQGHWDWFSVGGRWRGYFQAKPGAAGDLGRPGVPETIQLRDGEAPRDYSGRADQIQWKDVDLDGARQTRAAEAEREYDEYEEAVDGITPPAESFAQLVDRLLTEAGVPTEWDAFHEATAAQREAGDETWRKPWDDAIDAARATWNTHPWVRAIRKTRISPFSEEMEHFCVATGGRDEYVRRAVARTNVPYALVIKGEWIARGRMGWFGMSRDTATQDEWNAAVQAFYTQLDGDVWVTAVDCHV